MRINYCLPIIKTKKEDVMEMIKNNKNEYQYFEVWLDYIDNPDEKFMEDLSRKLKNNAIFLFRRKNLEKIKMKLINRKNIISRLAGSNSYLDLDIKQQTEELDYIKNNNLDIQTIVSYHNYKETPTDEKLQKIIENILLYKPTVVKISCVCNTDRDTTVLLNILSYLKKRKIRYIVSGMGKFGTIVKIQGALQGNEMTFAPLRIDESSAPGQFTKNEIENIINSLKN